MILGLFFPILKCHERKWEKRRRFQAVFFLFERECEQGKGYERCMVEVICSNNKIMFLNKNNCERNKAILQMIER